MISEETLDFLYERLSIIEKAKSTDEKLKQLAFLVECGAMDSKLADECSYYICFNENVTKDLCE